MTVARDPLITKLRTARDRIVPGAVANTASSHRAQLDALIYLVENTPVAREPGPDLRTATVVRVEPGDVVTLAVPEDISQDDSKRLGAQLQQKFPGNPCIVLTNGSQLGVFRNTGPEVST